MHIASSFLAVLLELLYSLLGLYNWVLIVAAVLSWLIAFDIVNPYSRLVRTISDITYRLTEPALRKIRERLPLVNGIDLSFLALMAIVWLLQRCILIVMANLVRL